MPSFPPHPVSRARFGPLAALGLPTLLALTLSGCGGGGGSSPSAPTGGTGAGLTHYSYSDLGAIGSAGTTPTAINDAGVVTGYFNTSDNGGGPSQPFRHTGTAPVTVADALALPSGTALGADPVSSSNLNASGTVVGTVFPASETVTGDTAVIQDAFVYDTSFHDLGALPLAISGRSIASATALNDAGTVVGYDQFSDQALTHAFRHVGTGPLTAGDDLGPFNGYPQVRASGVNGAGLIAGTGTAADGRTRHAFLYDTAFHDLGTLPGFTNSVATGLSSGGVVIGYGQNAGLIRSFRHTGTGPLTAADDLGQLPGGSGLAALAINAGGDVVGNAGDSAGLPTAFVLKAGGALQSLNSSALVTNLPAGFGLQSATGINGKGQIVGYTRINGTSHAWLLTPIP